MFGLGLSLSKAPVLGARGPSVPQTVLRLAHSILGPGNSDGGGSTVSAGSEVTANATYQNRSGRQIDAAALVFQGFYMTTSGSTATGNDYPVEVTIDYPIGTTSNTVTFGGNSSGTVPNGSHVISDTITLTTPIPAGSNFRIAVRSTTPNGNRYINTADILGFAGLLTEAPEDEINKAVAWMGDSITAITATAIDGSVTAVKPCYQAAISGTRGDVFAAGTAFDRWAALFGAMNCGFVSAWGNNDFALGGDDADELKTTILALQAKATAQGCPFVGQITVTPRSDRRQVSVVSLTSSSNTMTATVDSADIGYFAVGIPYVISGANEAEYNSANSNGRAHFATAVDTGANTITFAFVGSATTPATGTIIIRSFDYYTSAMQVPSSGPWQPGADRDTFNAMVRNGDMGLCVEWADAAEPSRGAGVWKGAGDDPLLLLPQSCTVGTPITDDRVFDTDYSRGNATFAGGCSQFIDGANIGVSRFGNNNGGTGVLTHTVTFPNTVSAGEHLWVAPAQGTATTDGVHPWNNAIGMAKILENATAAWMTANL